MSFSWSFSWSFSRTDDRATEYVTVDGDVRTAQSP
jgi:hypothetical protein